MKSRFRLYPRCNGIYYVEDTKTGKQTSLKTRKRADAERLFHAKHEAALLPGMNLQMARIYLTAGDPAMSTRTWQHVMEAIAKNKTGPTAKRYDQAGRDKALRSIRDLPLLETTAEHLLDAMALGTVTTNVYLRRFHNFALGMNWLAWPIVPRKLWPKVEYGEKRAITIEEHRRILAREQNSERRAFYQLAWHLGASQIDLANLHAEDVYWEDRTISFERRKTRWRGMQPPLIRFGDEAAQILSDLPSTGPFFPSLLRVRSGDRATEFKERCDGLGITGVTLHSYRYAWAERALKAGYPERYAQEALGHNSKAVHRAYAKKAQVIVPSLEQYEKALAEQKIIPMKLQTGEMAEGRPIQKQFKQP